MDFYTKKREAQEQIETMLTDHKKVKLSQLFLVISRKFGFGNNFVTKYLDLLAENNAVEVKNGSVRLLK